MGGLGQVVNETSRFGTVQLRAMHDEGQSRWGSPKWEMGVFFFWFVVVVVVVVLVLVLVLVLVVPSDPSFARIFSDVLPNGNRVFMCISYTGRAVSCIWRRGLFLLTFCALNDTLHDIHTSRMSNASVHTLHMPKPNVTRVQSGTEWTASVHTLRMSKPNVTRV